MGIDRIGKGGAAPPTDVGGADQTREPTKAGAVDKPFSVERSDRTKEAAPVDATKAASPLAQLKSGAIDVERYLDLKVDAATASLEGMPATELAEVKKMLRDQLASDPVLVDMVKSATGTVPKPPENE
jgi:hypothetical protein